MSREIEPESPGRGVNSVRIAFAVLEEITSAGEIGVSDLARRLGMPKSSAQRYVSTLHDLGWVTPGQPTAGRAPTRWRVGSELISLGLRASEQLGVKEIAEPIAWELRRRSGETSLVSVPEPQGALVVERFESAEPLRIMTGLGTYMPYVASAAGLAFLAAFDDRRVAEIVGASDPVLAGGDLGAELEAARSQGYAINIERWTSGVAAVGVAILDQQGAPRVAVSVTAPTSRFGPKRLHELGRSLMATAEPAQGLLR